ncbi:MAG: hypothetical protein ACFB14_23580 [Leptolyngbyaceae cyanobacterium]
MAFFPSLVQQLVQQRVSQLWQRQRLPQLAQRTCELQISYRL